MLGRTIGKYRIVEQIGHGGMGTVYKAIDETLDREVAIKVLNPDIADPGALARFRDEATLLARLNHPAIATIYELVRGDTDLLMVMEIVRGETLDALSDRLGPLPPDRAAYLIERILSALGYAHAAGVVHSDMKPANVMLTETGDVKIMDFGIARVCGAAHLTDDGVMMGTPGFMPPEQVLSQAIDGRADLYAVGVIFYRLLTGALPFEADTPVGVFQRQISDTPTPARFHRADLPDWSTVILRRALAKSPDDRFQTAEAFREAVARGSGMVTTTDLAKALTRTEALELRPPAPMVRATTLVIDASTTWDPSTVRSRWRPRPMGYVAVAGLVLASSAVVLALAGLRRPVVPASAAIALPAIAAPAIATTTIPAVASAIAPRAAPEVTAPAPKPAASPPRAAAKPKTYAGRFVFETKALVGAGSDQRVKDTTLVLADGQVNVVARDDAQQVVFAVPYATVTSISYSHSHEPLWRSPSGPAPVARIRRGVLTLGIAVDRHWISLATKTNPKFIVLRVNDADVGTVLAALQERIGVKPQRLDARSRT
jgi:eukaryotic-like serine/threonine-protein kinase